MKFSSGKLLRQVSRDTRGFVLIAALGIFGALMIVGIQVQKNTLQMYQSIVDSNNFYQAQDIAFSTSEYMQWLLKTHEGGFSTGLITCNYGDFDEGETNPGLCVDLDGIVARSPNQNVQVTFEIKGSLNDEDLTETTDINEDETFEEGCYGMTDSRCYVIPFPGYGTAVENCSIYRKELQALRDSGETVDAQAIALSQGADGLSLPHIDHPCNWNKLTHGSSMTDRVSIPLYYEDDDGEIISPFYDPDPLNPPVGYTPAEHFILRVRTACADGSEICSNTAHSELDDTVDDIVVQWQITGECETSLGSGVFEPCGMIQYGERDMNVKVGKNYGIMENFSAITEGRINFINSDLYNPNDSNSKVLYETLQAVDTSSYDYKNFILEKVDFLDYPLLLKQMQKPTLNLFLSGKLFDYDQERIPYLEYQLLTDQKIGAPSTKMEVTVNVDGNVTRKTLYKEQQKQLIDFAVQN